MSAYIIRRIIQIVPTLIGATLLVFLIIQLAPGDYLTHLELDPKFTKATIDNFRHLFGLDQPIWVQYLIWMKNMVLHGNLGYSFAYQAPVMQIIWPRIVNSMVLVMIGIFWLYVLGIPAGVFGALRPYTLWDSVVSFFAYFGLAIPNFFFALIIIFIFLKIKFTTGVLIFPVSGMTSSGFSHLSPWQQFWNIAWHAFVPGFVIVTAEISSFSRIMRSQMMETLDMDFIRTARAKGLRERTTIYKHAFRVAVIPFVATIGAQLPNLVGGAGLVEVVMSWPGITPLLLDSIFQQDLYVVAGFLTLSTILLVVGNVLGDVLLAWVDPRIRYS